MGKVQRRNRTICFLVFSTLLLLAGALVILLQPAGAECPTALNVDITDHPWLLVDSNKPGVEGPQVTTTLARITNTGNVTAENVYAYIGNGTTPGHFNPGSDGGRMGMLGNFTADATRYIVNLEPGQTKTLFWQLTFPFSDAQTYPVTVWAESSNDCIASDTHIYTTQSTISASANKVLGTIVVDPADGTVGVGNVVTIKSQDGPGGGDKTWDWGTIGAGMSNDQSGWIQPVGNIDFDPTIFRLIKTEIYVSSIGGVFPYGAMPYYDRLYFSGIGTQNPAPNYNRNDNDYYIYTFIALQPGNTTAKLYQEASSGTQEKYSGDYGNTLTSIALTAVGGNIGLTKDVEPEMAGANDTLTYTITYSNTGNLSIGDPDTGNGLLIIDEEIPGNTTYVAGSVSCSGNCSISYSTDNGATWTFTEPASEQVTNIRCYINEQIPAHSSGTVSFQVIVDADFPGNMRICNDASAGVYEGSSVISDRVCANENIADLSLNKSVDDITPCVGDTVTFTVNVSNSGPNDAHNITVTDIVPTGYTYVPASITGGDSNDDTSAPILTWNITTLATGTTEILSFNAIVLASGNYTNSAEITAVDEGDPNSTPGDGMGDDFDTATTVPIAVPACTITANPGTTACEGKTITLSEEGGNATGWLWSTGETTQAINVTTSGTYNVTAFLDSCNSICSIDVTFNPVPACSINADDPVCEFTTGNTASVAAGYDSYSWSIIGGSIIGSANGDSIMWTAGTAGTANISVSVNDGNCPNSCWTEVTINPEPTCTITANPGTTACEGETITLSEEGGDATGWLWSTGETTQSIDVTTSGTYNVTAFLDSCSHTCNTTVTFDPCPTPTVTLNKTANPTSVDEPGGPVTFTILIENTSDPSDPVTIDSLMDSVHGNLSGQGTCSVPQTIPAGGSYMCSFTTTVSGNAGYTETDVATASGQDDEGDPVSDDDDATVTITDVPSSISVDKTADPTSVDEPGGPVTFTVNIDNDSAVDSVTIDSLIDDIHGDLNGQGTCSVPQTIPAGGSYTCSFTATVSGNAGDSETDTATASGTDDDGNPVSDDDDATVTITSPTPTPSPSPSPSPSPTPDVILDPSTKTDSLFIDADNNGLVNPGDTLLYQVTIWNEGALDATGVVFTDTPDPNTTLVVGSVTTSKGAVIEGNNPGDSSLGVAIGTVLGGGPATETVTISFQVTINDPLPPGVYQVYNQGTIESNEAPPVVTDDPDTSASNDPTGTPLGRPPVHHIPTTSEWGMIGMGIVFAALLIWSIRRKLAIAHARVKNDY